MTQRAWIIDLIERMVAESAKSFEGMKRKDDWVSHHEPLSLMMAIETIKWMKEKDCCKQWISPLSGLRTEVVSCLKQFLLLPVGKSPENMPRDPSLKQDLHKCVQRHISMMHELSVEDGRKFDVSTPDCGAKARTRILEHVPTSERAHQDVNKVFESLDIARKAGGVRCQGVGNSNCCGKRHQLVAKKAGGGVRKRKLKKDDCSNGRGWVHPDAKEAAIVKMEHSVHRTEGKKTKPLAQNKSVEQFLMSCAKSCVCFNALLFAE